METARGEGKNRRNSGERKLRAFALPIETTKISCGKSVQVKKGKQRWGGKKRSGRHIHKVGGGSERHDDTRSSAWLPPGMGFKAKSNRLTGGPSDGRSLREGDENLSTVGNWGE